MSLLMEALKKAAQNKQDGPLMQVQDNPAATVTNNLSPLSLLPTAAVLVLEPMPPVSRPEPVINLVESDQPLFTPDQVMPLRVEPLEKLKSVMALDEEPIVPTLDTMCHEPPMVPMTNSSSMPTTMTSTMAPGVETVTPDNNASTVSNKATVNAMARQTEEHTTSSPRSAVKTARQHAGNESSKTMIAPQLGLIMGLLLLVIIGFSGFGYYFWKADNTTGMALTPPRLSDQPAIIPAEQDSHVAAPLRDSSPGESQTSAYRPQSGADLPVASAYTSTAVTPDTHAAVLSVNDARLSTQSNGISAQQESRSIQIHQSAPLNQVNASVMLAYNALIAGDLEQAQKYYQLTLRQEPVQRDALLGLAAIAIKQNQSGLAISYFTKLLEADPTDADALAGLVNLKREHDSGQSEERLKELLAQHPQSSALHFSLGNIYARKLRWADAQQAYFQAYSAAPDNPDYAFNLAITLDQLDQPRLALDYYQKAISLAQHQQTNFDLNAATNRIKDLLAVGSN
ncbi:tetratricopeptide repeat protein [Ampullimonas aquatilis]|uniref:tetratricopeptide repeat protein n=1 Tax=Ampullimonas aquatilis TaxID=1341549 RepID=UPI003C74D384